MVDLYEESWGTHPIVDALNVDVHLLSINAYKVFYKEAGFVNVEHMQFPMTSPATPSDFICTDYWPTYGRYLAYRRAGSLLLIGQNQVVLLHSVLTLSRHHQRETSGQIIISWTSRFMRMS